MVMSTGPSGKHPLMETWTASSVEVESEKSPPELILPKYPSGVAELV